MKTVDAARVFVALILVMIPLTPLVSHSSSIATNVSPTLTDVSTKIVRFASSIDWETYNADRAIGPAQFLGNAQFVCLNSFTPFPCPSGATLYGWNNGGWTANISSIHGANWIWAPNITGQTTPAEFNQFFFSRAIRLSGPVISGTLSLAADDFAEVRVNGQVVGTSGSVTDFQSAALAQHSLKTFDIAHYLVVGVNTITIRAENGPFGLCCPSSYAGNPAGVVFGGSISFQNV
jgi:hypothetical protein